MVCDNNDQKVCQDNKGNGSRAGVQEVKDLRAIDADIEKDRFLLRAELIEIIRKKLMNFIFDEDQFKDKVEELINQISKKELDPHSAAEEILGKILK